MPPPQPSPGLTARRRRAAGFTLLEIMVVIVIIAIMAAFAMLSVGSRSVDDRLEQESRRLGKLLALLSDEALFKSEQFGLLVETGGYRVMVLGEGGWAPFQGSAALKPHRVPEPLTLSLQVEGREVAPYDPDAAADESRGETESNDGSAGPTPQVLVLSSGEMTPFRLDFSLPDSDSRYRVEGDLMGRIKAARVEDEDRS